MKPSLTLLFTFFISLGLFAQDETSERKVTGPTLGFSVGSIGFYGDLNDNNYSAISGNPAYSLYFINPITSYLNLRISFLRGKVRGEERSLVRNVNFESNLTAGGVYAEYNFDHFLPQNRTITPFVTAGFEVVNFDPKTDLLANGEPYNYWSDGSIRNIPENSDNAQNAVIVNRDYSYETDIRNIGYNESDTYEEKTFAMPVGMGVSMKLNDQFNFRLQSIMHLTFSDYIDGVTPNSSREFVGGKKGNGNNDHFLVNSVSLTYNFQKVAPADPFNEEGEEEIDLLAYGNTEDFDNDGVIDLIDECPNTPRGLDIDTTGCPVDSDGDGVPDYKDEEIYSENPNRTNHKGVELTDEMIYQKYLLLNDSTLSYAEVIERDFTRGGRKSSAKYRVKVSEHKYGEIPENMADLLSLKDLSKIDQKDKTIYMVGNYKTIAEASTRAKTLNKQGFNEAEVLKKDLTGNYSKLNAGEASIAENSAVEVETTDETLEEVVFRVQLGAFKNQPTEDNFKSIPNLFVVESGGFYRYMSGAFNNFNQAARHKVEMIVEGYKGAFVVAYKNGKRVPLKSVGVNPIDSDPLIGE